MKVKITKLWSKEEFMWIKKERNKQTNKQTKRKETKKKKRK